MRDFIRIKATAKHGDYECIITTDTHVCVSADIVWHRIECRSQVHLNLVDGKWIRKEQIYLNRKERKSNGDGFVSFKAMEVIDEESQQVWAKVLKDNPKVLKQAQYQVLQEKLETAIDHEAKLIKELEEIGEEIAKMSADIVLLRFEAA